MQKMKIIAVFIALSLITVINFTTDVKSEIIHVGQGQTYVSIQDAIDDATDGDTVYVHAGYYDENLWINESITLEGESKWTVIVNNSGRAHNVNMTTGIGHITICHMTFQSDLAGEDGGGGTPSNNSFRNINGIGSYIIIHDIRCLNPGPMLRAAGGIHIGSSIGHLPFSNYTRIYNNYVEYGEIGVGIANGWYGEVFNNTLNVPMTEAFGIAVGGMNHTQIYDNTVVSGALGIVLSINTIYCEVYNNDVSGDDLMMPLYLLQNNPGTHAYNMIYQNDFTGGGIFAVALGLSPAYDCHDNYIFNNNFSNYFVPIWDMAYPNSVGVQFWYCYPTCGNYWTSHAGSDTNKGPLQNILGSDGIGDSTFMLDFGGVWWDNYPRMGPWNGTKVNWDNGPSFLSNENPQNETTDVSIHQPIVNVTITELCDTCDWSIEGEYINDVIGFSPGGNKWASLIIPLPYNTVIYWYVNLTDGIYWTNDTYHFTTRSKGNGENSPPEISNPVPENGSWMNTNNITEQFNITVNDADGDTMNVTWCTNASGEWVQFNETLNIGNGTYNATNLSWIDDCNVTYYWIINVTDGNAWNNTTFHFDVECKVSILRITATRSVTNVFGIASSVIMIVGIVIIISTIMATVSLVIKFR